MNYIKGLSHELNKKAYLKNNVKNFFLPTIGFSDDDVRNVEAIKKHFEGDPDNIIQTYSTSGGKKTKY